MARRLTVYNNFIAPSGTLFLKEKIYLDDGSEYSKVWSPFWDIVINKGCEDIPEEEKKDNKNWTWHSVHRNRVTFHIIGDMVDRFVEAPEPDKLSGIYIIGGKKKKSKKKVVKKK
jgi:hypothetical protein